MSAIDRSHLYESYESFFNKMIVSVLLCHLQGVGVLSVGGRWGSVVVAIVVSGKN